MDAVRFTVIAGTRTRCFLFAYQMFIGRGENVAPRRSGDLQFVLDVERAEGMMGWREAMCVRAGHVLSAEWYQLVVNVHVHVRPSTVWNDVWVSVFVCLCVRQSMEQNVEYACMTQLKGQK